MFNKIRKGLLALTFGLVITSGYLIYTKYSGAKLPIKIDLGDTGINVTIEDFKVTHEILGDKDWELKADSAKINTEENKTHLENVEVELFLEKDEKYWISADKGILDNETKDFDLEGNVKFVAEARHIIKKLHTESAKAPE
ncbi:MAG: LPS export ABC transporter periplasmic protein LptC [Nitrospinales bacterium]